MVRPTGMLEGTQEMFLRFKKGKKYSKVAFRGVQDKGGLNIDNASVNKNLVLGKITRYACGFDNMYSIEFVQNLKQT